jgi:hypothetical protein
MVSPVPTGTVVNSARVRTNFFPAARNVRHQAWGPMAALYRLPISHFTAYQFLVALLDVV